MYEKAVEMTPNDEELRAISATLTAGQAIPTKPLPPTAKPSRSLSRNCRSTRDRATIMGDLGLLYAKKGDAANALQYTNQARAISPDDVQLMYSEAR